MTLSTGDSLPDATLLTIGENGPETVKLSDKTSGRKVVIFALPGAYTGTCTGAHVPSFIRTKDDFTAKGVDEIICLSVNDPFVMDTWSETTGAKAAGITMLADSASEFAKATGLNFSAPPVGFYDRLKRSAMIVDNGTVTALHIDENPGVCDVSAGENLLSEL
ncbi:MAG: peroxiredoxin [Pseudomonadota bacterium]